ncbi:protein NPGR2 [Prosopis cineraria]|uniref:protein NPGR2 n=1 Tax=Prosopis cineraria TaxID=364024 RepID=UPI0024102815|nr:protein NPGR2 [Prosopis cineraria]XP_054823252.1 protein NPGR2 [Prosopis cineraria]
MKSRIRERRRGDISRSLRKIMKCLCSGEQLRGANEMVPSSESLATKDYSISGDSCPAGQVDKKRPDTGNIEEAESSLRESGFLNYEEARALLGRYEFQKGNIEAALHVFEGIDIGSVTPKIKISLAQRAEQPKRHKRHSQHYAAPPMSIHAVGLLLEAVLLKAKSLQALGRFKEAAQSCKVILDIVESSLPEGLPENFGAECKLQETLSNAVELLPELWKLADSPREAIVSYRRALLHQWNLDAKTTAKIQKEFVIFLLYSGGEASPPNLRSQMDSSFVPRNNIEEAILLLMILVRKITLKRIEWDPSILDHLSFALSVSGDLTTLAYQYKELLPGTVNRRERYFTLALCYFGAGKDLIALDLLRKVLSSKEDPKHIPALLMASKICSKNPCLAEEGVNFASRVLESLDDRCDKLESVAHCLLGISNSANSKLAISDSERFESQSEALRALETAGKMTRMRDHNVLYHLSLENAEQRKLDAALYYAKCLLKLEAGSSVKGWLLLARILSAKKRFSDAESIINAALDQTGKWDQGDLLRTKAKLQIAQGQLRSAIETYTQLLAVFQVQKKAFGSGKKLLKENRDHARNLEVEVWHDLACVYISLSQWHDAEMCLFKSKTIKLYSASRCHTTGILCEAKGLYKEALKAFDDALNIDPNYVPSLISTALVLRRCSGSKESHAVARSFLMDALRHDSLNAGAWYNLGLVHRDEGSVSSLMEAAECFEAAHFLEETSPVEPFR